MSDQMNTTAIQQLGDTPPVLAIKDFFRQCEERAREHGAMPLQAHIDSTVLADQTAARSLRNRAVQALKLARWKHLLGEVIENDGSRASVFQGMEAKPNSVPAPHRPSTVTATPLGAVATANQFRLPGTAQQLTALGNAIAPLSRRRQEQVVTTVMGMSNERTLEVAEKDAATERLTDLREQLAETRRDKAFLQQMLMEGKSGGGKAVTR